MKSFLVTLYILFLVTRLYGIDGRQYHFAHLDMDDGLSHNDITSILQDKSGFMWFATRDGLNRYDGHKVKTYSYRINDYPVTDLNCILSLCEGRDGTIWIGSRGISFYHSKGDSLQYFNKRTQQGQTPTNMILSIQVNSDGWMYYLEQDKGIYCYKPESDEFLFYPFSDDVFSFTATTMWIDGNDRVWLGGGDGCLFILDQSCGKYHSIQIGSLKSPDDQLQVIEGNDHFIYLGFQYSGIIRYDLTKKSFSSLPFDSDIQDNVFVHDILIDENVLWVATEKGLYLYDETTKHTTKLQKDYFDLFSLSDNAVYSIYKDAENGLWIGTYFGGVNYVSLSQTRFVEFYYPLRSDLSLKGRAVREICQDESGCLWIGTEDGGLHYFNPETRVMMPKDIGLDYNNVHGMAIVDEQLFVGTFSGGLNIYDLRTKAISHHYISDSKYNVDNSIYSICYDRKKRIWICTQKGVYLFEKHTGRFIPVEGLEDVYVHHVLEDSNGNIWLSSVGRGLICYTNNGEIIDCERMFFQRTGSHITRVLNAFEDSENRLWICTSGYGVICYNIPQDTIICYSTSNGLPDNMAYKAIQDNLGNIWIGTNRGLVRINPGNNQIRIFTKEDGLLTNHFNYNSAFRDCKNRLYFGSVDGLAIVDPSEIKEDLTFPPIYLTSFQLYNKEVLPSSCSVLDESITHLKELKLEYNQNYISFDYAVLRYDASKNNICSYMLEGLDSDWILGDNSKISYSNLNPGKYKLRLRSSNSAGEWKEVCTLNICILPPWWETTFAYICYAILFSIICVVACIFVARRINETKKAIIQEVEQKKERESYRAKMEFFTNIAHEIKTPLTLIKAPLEYILHNKTFDSDTKNSLITIMKNTERLLSLSYQLLDFRKIEVKQMQMNFEGTDIVLLLQNIYTRFYLAAEQQGVNFTTSFPDEHLTVEVDVEAFTKIMSNLFTNALKYSSKYINVSLEREENRFIVIVENDGEVILPQMREAIFEPFVQVSSQQIVSSGRGLGLPLARSLAELHGGTLSYDSNCCDKNRFILSLPYSHDLKSEALSNVELQSKHEVEKRQTILVVEDNLEMLDFVSRKMMTHYNVNRAMDGMEAIKVLNDVEVDLVISDIMMPNMDGMELLKTIKSHLEYSHIPVVLLTAKSNLQSKVEGLELGADAYVEKPFSLEYLQAQVQSLLKNRQLVKELFAKRPLADSKVVALTQMDELFLNKVNEVIESNLTNLQFSVDILAEKLNMSRSSLHRKIKGVMDLTPNDYIKVYRLKKAAVLLRESGYRVNEIASLTGFTSSSYFTKCFQQYFQMLPKEFIKNK